MNEMDRQVERLRVFSEERDWEQFHTPKNLAMASSVEASELLELFQWMTPEESCSLDESVEKKVGDELADTFNYLLLLSDVLGIDLMRVAQEKMVGNGKKYPVEKVRGRSDKYDVYEQE